MKWWQGWITAIRLSFAMTRSCRLGTHMTVGDECWCERQDRLFPWKGTSLKPWVLPEESTVLGPACSHGKTGPHSTGGGTTGFNYDQETFCREWQSKGGMWVDPPRLKST